jgi:hypothetical protein
VDAAGVVADHAANGAAVVAGGIWRERQVIFLGGVAKMVEDDSGLDAREAALGIDLENVAHVLREIEDDGNVAALSGERCASTAAKQGRAELAAGFNRSKDVGGVTRENNADRDLAIVGAVGGVESACTVIESDVPANTALQEFSESDCIRRFGL